jgi:hypothetical protein
MSSESAWLQKALFALQRAQDARGKLADARGEEAVGFVLDLDGDQLAVTDFQAAMENRVKVLLDEVGARRKTLP